jgi:hypothetical protein
VVSKPCAPILLYCVALDYVFFVFFWAIKVGFCWLRTVDRELVLTINQTPYRCKNSGTYTSQDKYCPGNCAKTGVFLLVRAQVW